MSLTALCYNWGFFTVLGYAPFPMNLSPIKLGLVFTGWGLLVAIFAVFGAPRLQSQFGIARTMYANLAAFAVLILVIAIWTTDRAVLIPAVIASGIFIGVNNTITTQAVMTISPVERPVASAAYSFVRFIGGGIAPYAAGRLVIALNIHVPFFIAAGAVVAGIVILTTMHRRLADAERVQAEQVGVRAAEPSGSCRCPASRADGETTGIIVAAVDDSPMAGMVTEAAARMAAESGRPCPRRARQGGGGWRRRGRGRRRPRRGQSSGLPVTSISSPRTAWPPKARSCCTRPTTARPAGWSPSTPTAVGAATIVIGAPSHGGLPALIDGSSSRELLRLATSDVMIINPAAPAQSAEPPAAETAGAR